MKNTLCFICPICELVSQNNSMCLITAPWTRGESGCNSRRGNYVALHNSGIQSKQPAVETKQGLIFRRWSGQERETDQSSPVTAEVKLLVPLL